ncbi:MAG: hypothetical protein IJ609_00295 [Paludibacteraceae bacterium]|nr:hypothetical protein [Paludibacteraceae bacterium]MBR1480358.1 hypothetical protein [Paludibacteraceae bacterium]
MSQASLESPVAELHGKYSKDGTIFRQKKYRSDTGAVLHACVQEAYKPSNPRNFKKTPPKGAELANMNRFGEAHRRAHALLNAGRLTPDELAAMPAAEREATEQLRAQFAAYQARFERQLTAAPDPQAPLLPKTSPGYIHNPANPQRRRYYTLVTFLRAIISMELKAQ